MIIENKKHIFIHIPKNAGTSITHWLVDELDGIETSGPVYSIPEEQKEKYKLHQNEKHRTLSQYPNYEDYYSWAIVKNPFDRFVSMYHWTQRFKKRYRNITWEDWLKISVSDKREEAFEFFRNSQCQFISDYSGEEISKIIRFENLQEGLKEIANKLDIPLILPHENKSTRKPYQEYYDKKSIDVVANLFADDIEYFGYTYD